MTDLHTGQKTRPLGITMGDAAGIGPEIIVKLHAKGLSAPCVVYGDMPSLQRAAKALNSAVKIIALDSVDELNHAHLLHLAHGPCMYVRPTFPSLPETLALGSVDARAGQAAYDALCMAIDDAQLRRVDERLKDL